MPKSFSLKTLNLCSQIYALVVSTMKNSGERYALKLPKKQRFQHESLGFSKMDLPKMSIFDFSDFLLLKFEFFRI